MKPLQWLLDNKEWVFSGVGVALIVALVAWLRRPVAGTNQRQEGGSGSRNIQAGRDINLNVHPPAPHPPPDEFHELEGIQMEQFRADPEIGSLVVSEERQGAEFSIPTRRKLSHKLSEGFEHFVSPAGKRCRYTGVEDEYFLLIRRPHPRLELRLEGGVPTAGVWHHKLTVKLKNPTTRTISSWHVDVLLPARLLNQHTSYMAKVPDRSNAESWMFRGPSKSNPRPVLPGDAELAFLVDLEAGHALGPGDLLLEERILARAYVGDVVQDERSATVGELLRESGVAV